MSALSSDNEQLGIDIVTKLGELEKQMAKANGITARAYREMTLSSRKATKQMEDDAIRSTVRINQALASVGTKVGAFGKAMTSALGTLGGGFAGGLIGGMAAGSLTQIVGNLGSIAKGIAEVGDKAKMAGLSNKAFQELAYVASQNRIEVDALTDGMKELQLRADEWIKTGSGSGAESFQRLGFTASELATRLKDPSALLVEIIRRVQQLDKAAQIRVFDELFGGQGGEKFVQLIDQGADGLARTVDEAHQIGAVLGDDIIAKADEVDRKFARISTTISTGMKAGIIEVVEAWDELMQRLDKAENRSSELLGKQLVGIYAKREALKDRLASDQDQLQQHPENIVLADQIETEKAQIKALNDAAAKLRDVLDRRAGWQSGKDVADTAADATPKVGALNSALSSTNSGATSGANGLKTYADAIHALAGEVPELAKSLAELDARNKIESTYAAAVSKARTMGEVLGATNLRDRALTALANKDTTEAAGKGMLDLIGTTEGTDKGRGYNETLGYGKFTGGDRNLVVMSLDDIDKLQSQMLADPSNTFNSSALGRYQITRTTLRGLRDKLGLKGTDTFDPAMQDRLAEELLRQRGNNPDALRKEWTSLQGVDDATIRGAYDKSSLNLGSMDSGLQQQKTAYDEIVASAREYIASQNEQASLVGHSAEETARLRHEQELLAEAQRAGIALTPEQTAALRDLAAGMSEAERNAADLAASQGKIDAWNTSIKDTTKSAMKGFVSDLVSGKSAADALADALGKIGDKVLDMALDTIFDSLFKGASGGGGGLLSWLFSANGNAFGSSGVIPFASGGVVDKPTFFKFASGAGVMGEAGPEAIMPLKRGADGKLGVAAQGAGGGNTSVYSPTVNVAVQSSGNRQADEHLARRMNDEVKATLDNHMLDFINRESRNGGVLNSKKFT